MMYIYIYIYVCMYIYINTPQSMYYDWFGNTCILYHIISHYIILYHIILYIRRYTSENIWVAKSGGKTPRRDRHFMRSI